MRKWNGWTFILAFSYLLYKNTAAAFANPSAKATAVLLP